VASLLLLALVLGVALFFSNRMVSKKLWQPFYTTLSRLRDYQLNEAIDPQFPQTNVREFNELIDTLTRLIERIRTDYINLKEYTENTTHEIQTPLAIIQSKLELLQEHTLTIEQHQLVSAANRAVSRLARLKEALLLLVRIKNKQYMNTEPVNIANVLEARLAYFEELMEMKEIRLCKQIREQVMVHINPVLAEVLVDNLVSNAIKYNIPGGTLGVELTDFTFTISNTGQTPGKPTAAFFNRFVKSDSSSKSLGLGLSIVKAICETNRLEVEYEYIHGLHQITVSFPSSDNAHMLS